MFDLAAGWQGSSAPVSPPASLGIQAAASAPEQPFSLSQVRALNNPRVLPTLGRTFRPGR